MAFGKNVDFATNQDARRVVPISTTSEWKTVIPAGGLDDADNSGNRIVNPTTQVEGGANAANRYVLKRNAKEGTTVRARMAYPHAASTVTTQLVVQAFGRTGSQPWQPLHNADGNHEVTITADAANDITDGTNKRTAPHPTTHAWDCDGCDEICFGVKTALNLDSTHEASAFLEAKII